MAVTQQKSFVPLAAAASGWPKYQLRQAGVGTPVVDWTNVGVTQLTNAVGTPVANYYVDLSVDPSAYYTISWDNGDGTVPPSDNFAGSTPQTGDSFARIGAPVGASISADIQTRSTYAGGSVSSVVGDVGGNVAGSVGSVTAPVVATTVNNPVTVGTNNDKTGYTLTQVFPNNFGGMVVEPDGSVLATVEGFSGGVTVPLPVGTGTGQILLSNGMVTAITANPGVQVATGTITAASSSSNFTATMSSNASGNPAAYVGKVVIFQSGGDNQQRGIIQSVTISGSPGSYVVTFTMNTSVTPAIQVTPTLGDTFDVF